MTDLSKRLCNRRRPTAASEVVDTTAAAELDRAVLPQDFYDELAQRDDVRRILTRLAQVEDEHS